MQITWRVSYETVMSSLLLKLGPVGSIRGTTESSHGQIFSMYDFINRAFNKEISSVYASNNYHGKIKENPDYKDKLIYFKFSGRGGKPTPCTTIQGLQSLLAVLGTKIAAENREILENTLSRVMAGDQSLIEVINASPPIHKAAIVAEPVAPGLNEYVVGKKREREELEHKMRLAQSRLAHVQNSVGFLQSLNINIDEQMKAQLELFIKQNMMLSLEGEQDNKHVEPERLYVSGVAKKMGFKPNEAQRMKIGSVMLAKYQARYNGKIPEKRDQTVGDEDVRVNVYLPRDRDLMEEAVREVMEPRANKA